MSEKRFKVGDKVIVREGARFFASVNSGHSGAAKVVLTDYGSGYDYRVRFAKDETEGWVKTEDVSPASKTLDDLDTLEVGDKLKNGTQEVTILGICGRVLLLSFNDNPNAIGSKMGTCEQLKKDGWTVKEAAPTEVKKSVAEIEKELGMAPGTLHVVKD